MKKTWIFIPLAALVVMFVVTTQVLASPADPLALSKTYWGTPGAKATLRATQGTPSTDQSDAAYDGSIAAVDSASLTLTLSDGSSASFVITQDTRIKISTLGRDGTVADLKAGMDVRVWVARDSVGTLTALTIKVVQRKPTLTHQVGAVTDYQPGVSITIQRENGGTDTYQITAATRILPAERADQLAVGVQVTVVVPRNVTRGNPVEVLGIVVHAKVNP